MELAFFEGRVSLNSSWYRNRSSNQLIGQTLAVISGFSTVQINLPALIENRGIELELNTINIRKNNFSWSTAFNISRPRNELVEFPDIELFTGYDNFYEVGKSLNGRKQYESLGVNAETGEYIIRDINEDGRIGIEDRQDFVEIFQSYHGGINNGLAWKGFQLDFFFAFTRQNARNFNAQFSSRPGNRPVNQPVNVLDRWQSPGDVTGIQRFSRGSNRSYRNHGSSRLALVDASFIRLQNVSLSWMLPADWTRRAKMDQVRLYIQGQNLLVFTRYRGIDPETQGLSLPPLRWITTGVQLSI